MEKGNYSHAKPTGRPEAMKMAGRPGPEGHSFIGLRFSSLKAAAPSILLEQFLGQVL
jgi:hypothetical protein